MTTTVSQQSRGKRLRSEMAMNESVLPSVFSLANSEVYRLAYVLRMPLFLVGLGTTGSAVVRRLVDRVVGVLGKLPSSVDYLLIDATTAPFDNHRAHFVSIGEVGCGTLAHVGRERFLLHYDLIRGAWLCYVNQIVRQNGDAVLPCAKSAREIMGFVLVGTASGGTSGGCLDPAISLTHDLAQLLSINPRVHVVTVSPEMVLRDIARQPIPEQVEMVHANYGQNQTRILAHMQMAGNVVERRPDGSTFVVKARDRVFSIDKVDRSNGMVDFSTTEDMVSMLANTLHHYLLTAAGDYVDQRDIDNRDLGALENKVN